MPIEGHLLTVHLDQADRLVDGDVLVVGTAEDRDDIPRDGEVDLRLDRGAGKNGVGGGVRGHQGRDEGNDRQEVRR